MHESEKRFNRLTTLQALAGKPTLDARAFVFSSAATAPVKLFENRSERHVRLLIRVSIPATPAMGAPEADVTTSTGTPVGERLDLSMRGDEVEIVLVPGASAYVKSASATSVDLTGTTLSLEVGDWLAPNLTP